MEWRLIMGLSEDGENEDMIQAIQPLCIGEINYTNVWPVFHHFSKMMNDDIIISRQVPSRLNAAMAQGEVDIGPISSFSYAEHADQYELFPNLSVSCDGRVNSILLFHRKPLQDLRNSKVALPTTSASSVNLLKILLRRFYDCEPDYFYAEPNLDSMLNEADAALLIGDDAIRASWRTDALMQGLMITDLGECWKIWTGHSMTYAVWAVRRQAIEAKPHLVEKAYLAFMESKRMSLQNPQLIIERAIREIGGSVSYWQMYFRHLSHDFSKVQQEGLSLYFEYAYELGLLERSVSLQLWDHHTVA